MLIEPPAGCIVRVRNGDLPLDDGTYKGLLVGLAPPGPIGDGLRNQTEIFCPLQQQFPDDQCPPGSHPEFVCDEFGCYETCIPDDVCPPGSYLETRCDEFGNCWQECIPEYPECPPGTHPEVVCFEDGLCYEECVPDDPNVCPPGSYPEVICDEMGCYEYCVPEQGGGGEPGQPGME